LLSSRTDGSLGCLPDVNNNNNNNNSRTPAARTIVDRPSRFDYVINVWAIFRCAALDDSQPRSQRTELPDKWNHAASRTKPAGSLLEHAVVHRMLASFPTTTSSELKSVRDQNSDND